MKQLGQIGWNHSFVNTKKDGKNIFFFRDSCHINQGIQDKLYSAIKDKIDSGVFNKLFMEGWNGEYPNQFDSKEDIQEWHKETNQLVVHANYLLCGEYLGKNLLWGVEDMNLLNLHKRYETRKFQLINLGEMRKLSIGECEELFEVNRVISEILKERDSVAVDNAIKYMDNFNVRTAGIIFGDLHFENMLGEFRDRDIGVISYFSGKIKVSRKECIKYLEQISKI